ncbi:hypothetical protein N7493_001657 [Penicillium malachiteum]|uniref:Uncharacterized protein n=1 Tax=Penicillium malachiteum TaxID=1324776 RepID=A0AAD6HUK3_9EURO|nr:hypothetical protein N7493_001657 [Penicillium malachiteum]
MPFMQEINAIYDFPPCGYNFDLLFEGINNSQLNWVDPTFIGASCVSMASAPPHENELHQQTVAAFSKLRQYSNAEIPSRPGSPEAANAHAHWLKQLGQKQTLQCGKVI